MLRKYLSKILKILFWKIKYSQHLPNMPLYDDIYIVEFPKSGITWLSFIIANIDILMSDSKIDITFFNIHKFVPDVHQLRGASIGNKKLNFINRRLIKTHSSYNPYYYSTIYLLRNPFDVMKSYYRYKKNHGYSEEFGDFIRSPIFGINAWVSHVESWLYQHKNLPQRLFVLRHEDLKKENITKLQDLYKNLGFNISEDIIRKVFKITDIENMRKSEELYKQNDPRYKIRFIGKGSVSKGQDIDSVSREYITKQAHEILQDYYPEYL